jgi:hypothetical protein
MKNPNKDHTPRWGQVKNSMIKKDEKAVRKTKIVKRA